MAIGNDSDPKVAAIKAALMALSAKTPSQQEQTFSEAYDEIRDALRRKIPHKTILAAMAKEGLKMSVATFRKRLAKEAERRVSKALRPGEC